MLRFHKLADIVSLDEDVLTITIYNIFILVKVWIISTDLYCDDSWFSVKFRKFWFTKISSDLNLIYKIPKFVYCISTS